MPSPPIKVTEAVHFPFALCGFQDLVEYLIVKYPQQVSARGGFYVTPLVAALAGRHFQTAEFLRLSGADPNVQCFEEDTPLHSAACHGDVEIVQVLLNLEADVNIRNKHNRTPLNYIHGPSFDFVEVPNYRQSLANVTRLLLDRGADINSRNDEGQTPLHTTASMGWIEAVRVLLERGADVGAEDGQGKTPFSLAKERGYEEIMKLLSEDEAE